MKAFGLRLALQSALSALAFSALAIVATCNAAESGEAAQGLDAKVVYCKTCHGLSAEGYRGYVTMPRLAGQQPEYIVNQLRAFAERRRLNPVMVNVSHGLTPGMYGALAERFKALNPPPFGGAPHDNLALGRSIFETGLPDANVPACSACHGPEGRGQGQIPRLAGQLYWYTVKALRGWSAERGQGSVRDTSAIMSPTSHNLTPAQVSAIAAYVSTLR
jgi:cytochrome c553